MFRKVLIANRGEIAVRMIRTLREMEIASVAVFSDADRTSRHVRMADEAEWVAPRRRPKAICAPTAFWTPHASMAPRPSPGYGFLSENADFAAACEAAGMVFIGPSAESIRRMGSKTAARQMAIAAGAPVVPGTHEALGGPSEARAFAAQFGYPLLLKAVAGGGGKGMRRVDSGADLDAAYRDAASEAERSFSNPDLYVEKLIERPRHIEIQLMGDRHGHMVHFGERECSIQRRHQKVMEECPSPLVAARPACGKPWARPPSAWRSAPVITMPARSNSWWTPAAISFSWR